MVIYDKMKDYTANEWCVILYPNLLCLYCVKLQNGEVSLQVTGQLSAPIGKGGRGATASPNTRQF